MAYHCSLADYDARIPFLIRGPGVPAGAVSTAPVSHVDLMPTILQLSGVPIPPYIDGQSIVPLLQGAGALPAAQTAEIASLVASSMPEGDPARDVATLSVTSESASSLLAAGWTRQTIFYSYHGEYDSLPPVCVNSGITDPALTCYAQTNGSLTYGPYPPAGWKPYCSCQDAMNNTYACMRTVNASANYRYCEFQLQPAAAVDSGVSGAAPTPFVEYFDISVDPYEMTNAAANLSPSTAAQLHAQLQTLMTCVGTAACNQF